MTDKSRISRISRITLILAILGLSPGVASCIAHGQVTGHAHVDAPRATLVSIGPGLWVVEDYDRPVFYYGDWYWLYSDGIWLRSRVYTGSFVRVRTSVVPRPLVRIRRPHAYVRYKARGSVRVRKAPPPRVHGKTRSHHKRDNHRRGHHKH